MTGTLDKEKHTEKVHGQELILIPEKLEKFFDGMSNNPNDETVRIEDKVTSLECVKNSPTMESCDFETAIAATGYGKYNILILALSLFPMISCLVTTSTMSLIFPSAECDLKLNNVDKGMLNAITYVGMIISAFVWGFLSDTMGRKNLLVISFAIESVLAVIVGLAQTFPILLAAKLIDGMIISGPYAILMTYLAETHSAEHRAKTIQWTGAFSGLGTIAMPMLALVIIPSSLHVKILGGIIDLPSWRIFLLICSIPSIISTVGFYFVRESPKFLMSHGRNDEALEALQVIYSLNSGLPKSTYAVKSLIIEKISVEKLDDKPKSFTRYLNLGWMQIKPLFINPHVKYAILIFTIQFCGLWGLNTIRLWMPQIFSSIIDAEKLFGGNATDAVNGKTVCEVLQQDAPHNKSSPENCDDYHVDTQVFLNSTIIGLVTAVGYFLSGFLVKTLGKKWLIIVSSVLGSVLSASMYWAINSTVILILSSLFIGLISISSTALIGIVVDLFPTALRSMAVSLTMMFGRIGAMTGNVCFSILIDWSCTVPFFLMGAMVLAGGAITCFLPKTKGKALE